MEWMHVALLLGAGLGAGFIAGLIGVGGGVVFTPVLLFYFQHIGIPPEIVPELTIGTSLFCTLIAALASARYQYRRGAVAGRTAVGVGLSSALAVFLMTLLVTTKPWYDATVFQVIFGLLLLVVVGRMVLERRRRSIPIAPVRPRWSWPTLFATGSAAGAVASAAGVGGGVVLVPAYNRFMQMPIHRAVGTSSATIVLISLAGIASYAVLGWNAPVPSPAAIGYVDVGRALLLSIPAVLSARLGVWASHRLPTRPLQLAFAAVALFVGGRMLYGALL